MSEESQGLEGARKMFQTSQRLEEVTMAVQATRTLPAQFVEDLGKDLATQVVAQTAMPVVSTGLAGISRAGEDADALS